MINCYGVHEQDITEEEIAIILTLCALKIGIKTFKKMVEIKKENVLDKKNIKTITL